MPATELTCFKAYDVRGRLGVDLDADIARVIGQGFAEALGARRVVLGRDIRASSAALAAAVAEGLVAQGVEVLDLGLCGTEEVYFATEWFAADGGICVTASHNPMDYNGMKMVGPGARPLDPAGAFGEVRRRAEAGGFAPRAGGRVVAAPEARAAYVERVLSFVDARGLGPVRLLVNAGNGAAGPTFDAIVAGLVARGAQLDVVRLHHDPDGRFPNGIPNPLLPENQPVTGQAVRAAGADIGVAWDGDFDRCFFFDETGAFVPGELVVGMLAEEMLAKHPGAAIVYDPRVVWGTEAALARAGGRGVRAPTGHAYFKAAMRDSGAVYGGEMSAHHYFRDFMSCDSGMIPWLLVLDLMARRAAPLSEIVAERRAAFPSSGEINFQVDDVAAALARVEAALGPQAQARDDLDGLSLSFGDWRMNLRASNTEPLLRLNVEGRGDAGLVARKRDEIAALITVAGA